MYVAEQFAITTTDALAEVAARGVGDLITHADPPAAECGDPGTEPATGRGALGVVDQRLGGDTPHI